jgi:hypothetical protein
MGTTTTPDAPECERMVAVAPESQKIGEFLDWLGAQGIHLAAWDEDDDRLHPHGESFERLLARYFEIDLAKVEQERRAILASLQEG